MDPTLLVGIPAGMSLLTLARLENELALVLDAKVDIVTAGSLRAHLTDSVIAKAVPFRVSRGGIRTRSSRSCADAQSAPLRSSHLGHIT